MTTTSSVTAGPWQQPQQTQLTPEQIKTLVLAAIRFRREIHIDAECREIESIGKRQIERLEPALKAQADLTVLRLARETLTALSTSIAERGERIRHNAAGLLDALAWLEDAGLSVHQQGALIGIDHRHIGKAGGLLQAATKPPTDDGVSDALMTVIIERMMGDPIAHRKARGMLNNLLGTELPLPPRPRPQAV
ncbi:MAG: hypothetical protein K9L82_06445 [Chromatiaceae bacterium]|nr:hypothetical protein [Chromatiaceae bacterium]MCF7993848.1 hypothetical protein [Chromatiaceae bacterium]MCF8003868.1 hypothetical protein [Chromatiaceae bacterium]MCF8017490.1 hypothetical protein [Chromatiaceae bacterium]